MILFRFCLALFLYLLLILNENCLAQENYDPTLSVGLESLTFGKGTIDIDALRKIIVKKQNELKREGLKRYVFSKFPENNYTTKLFIQNTINTLVDEKNQDIIEKELLELATNYALVIGFTKLYKEVYYKGKKSDLRSKDSTLINEITKYYDSLKLVIKIDKKDTLLTLNQKDQLLIDIVGTQLSHNKLLKEKGFFDFDSKINFTYSRLFNSLGIKENVSNESDANKSKENESNKNQNSVNKIKNQEVNERIFNSLGLEINDIINAYLNSYNYIKEILVSKDYNKLKNIRKQYLDDIHKTNFDPEIFKNYATENGDNELLGIFSIGFELNKYHDLVKDYNRGIDKLNSFKKNGEKLGDINLKNVTSEENVNFNLSVLTSRKLNLENYKKEFVNIANKLEEARFILKKIKSEAGSIVQENSSLINARDLVRERLAIIRNINSHKVDINKQYDKATRILQKLRETEDNWKNFISNIEVSDNSTERIEILKDSLINKSKLLKNELDSTFDDYRFNAVTERLKKLTNLEEFESLLKTNSKSLFNNTKSNIGFLKGLLKNISNNLVSKNFNLKDSIFIKDKAEFFSNLYIRTRKLSEKDNFTIDDVLYFENQVLPELIQAKILIADTKNDETIDAFIKAINGIIPIMNYFLIPPELEDLEINEDVISFFGFISKINELDKANTFSYILQLLDESHNFFVNTIDSKLESEEKIKYQNLSKFKNIYEKIINGIDKYTIINNEEQLIEIDVLSFLNTFIENYNKESSYGKNTLYFSIGFSQNLFLSDYNYTENNQSQTLNSIGFASEKIGYKKKLLGFKNKGYDYLAKSSIAYEDKSNELNPFVNQWYLIAYGSGLLYKIADLTTNENFDFPHVGVGTGLRLYNTLDVSITIGFPIIDGKKFGDNGFLGLSLDIPITEYLSAIGSKN
ncbi:hypothetical protein IWQ47_001177 [Aquimarina sp. EL_43]|uniref:hypothetical protein n=1 Tax=unclassified Aquimarina TaxID=2627091 RepID=UPI0018CA40CA|nr:MULTISPECIES: hypothetical protein [unclassified Aquimarina]MBG6129520.1 hypothetical protein [Aquimarina sp. EL_35]MBG6150585.1 hypothetical protein [Aquimarina sp. EL_32]MBG6168107.1 hypothetical protein [Aquimarina sp. EL_43]